MAVGKEIRTQIASVKNTAEDHQGHGDGRGEQDAQGAGAHGDVPALCQQDPPVIGHLLPVANPESSQVPFLRSTAKRSSGSATWSSSRRTGVFAAASTPTCSASPLLREIKEWQGPGHRASISACSARKAERSSSASAAISSDSMPRRILGEDPEVRGWDLIGTLQDHAGRCYRDGRIDRLFMISNTEFVNTMTQKPEQSSSCCRSRQSRTRRSSSSTGTTSTSPVRRSCWTALAARYIESQVYRSTLENVACEMAARMVAMKSGDR